MAFLFPFCYSTVKWLQNHDKQFIIDIYSLSLITILFLSFGLLDPFPDGLLMA